MADDLLLVFVEQAKLEGRSSEAIERMLERVLYPYGKPFRLRDRWLNETYHFYSKCNKPSGRY